MKKTFISYKDDNEQVISGFVDGLEYDSTLVRFQTEKNKIIIPFHRVLKIKEAKDGN